jgi:hypothetical protein
MRVLRTNAHAASDNRPAAVGERRDRKRVIAEEGQPAERLVPARHELVVDPHIPLI